MRRFSGFRWCPQDPFFPPEVFVYLVPASRSCPTSPTDSLYVVADAAAESGGAELLLGGGAVRATAKDVSFSGVVVEVNGMARVWLAVHGAATLCWLYSRGPAETGCPSPNDCVVTFGKLYWVGKRKQGSLFVFEQPADARLTRFESFPCTLLA